VARSSVGVWDPLVRLVHWSVAALVLIDLVDEASANPWHRYFGYAAAALVVLRLAWGMLDSGHARLAAIWTSVRRALPYSAEYLRGRAEIYVGHNPLGALMAASLWALILLVALTGWMQRLDAFWGDEWLHDLHRTLAYVLAACSVAHVAGAVATSAIQRTNLTRAMITGRKSLPAENERPPGPRSA